MAYAKRRKAPARRKAAPRRKTASRRAPARGGQTVKIVIEHAMPAAAGGYEHMAARETLEKPKKAKF